MNFTDSDSEGQDIVLFGKTYTVGTATDSNTLVLLGGSDSATVNVGETKSLTVGDTTYDVTLTGISSSTTAPSAGLKVNGESKTFTEGQTKTIGGIDVYVKTVFKTGDNAGYVKVQLGADKLTFENGKKVMTGSDDTKIKGTLAYLGGGTTAMTTLAVSIAAPDNANNDVLVGDSFMDPVFGSIKLDFVSVANGPVFTDEADTSSARHKLDITKNGNRELGVTVTDSSGNTKALPFAYQDTLADDSDPIQVVEGASMDEDDYFIIDSGSYQHMFQVSTIDIAADQNDDVEIEDMFTGTTYDMGTTTNLTARTGTIVVSGQTYTVASVMTHLLEFTPVTILQ